MIIAKLQIQDMLEIEFSATKGPLEKAMDQRCWK
jgi:hypothetical protein